MKGCVRLPLQMALLHRLTHVWYGQVSLFSQKFYFCTTLIFLITEESLTTDRINKIRQERAL